jgi:hypothetical protein
MNEDNFKNEQEIKIEYLNEVMTNIIKKNENESFDVFNTTTVTNLFYASCGIYGDDIKNFSLLILEEFIIWSKKKPVCYICRPSYESMFHPWLMEKLLEWCKQQTPLTESSCNNIKNNLMNKFETKKNELMIELYENNKKEYDEKIKIMLSTPRSNFYDTPTIDTNYILKWYIVGSIVGVIIGKIINYFIIYGS